MPPQATANKSDKAAKDREAATAAFVDVAFDDAWALREEYSGDGGWLERRKANREQLRSLARQGKLTDEQLSELEELYPRRERDREEAEEASGEPTATE